jgi:uncharacterized membrane protein YjdF
MENIWMEQKKRKWNWRKILFWFVLVTLIASTAYAVVAIVRAPESLPPGAPFQKVKWDYVVLLLLCGVGVLCTFLPSMLERKLKLELPNYMHIAYVMFLYAAIYLGEVRNFYYDVPQWDTMLHISSGVMLGALGFFVVDLLNRDGKVRMQLSPLFVAIFAFGFAVTLGTMWEICEFTFDSLFDGNMQKYMLQDRTPLVGQAALLDTMKDLVVDVLGALVTCIIGGIAQNRQQKRRDAEEGKAEEAAQGNSLADVCQS